MFESNEIMVAMKREAFLVASLLLTGISIGVYIVLKYFDFVWISNVKFLSLFVYTRKSEYQVF